MNTEQVIEAYKEACSHWIGCDWDIYFEGDGPNLKGISSEEATSKVHATTGEASDRWHRAARWLASVEEAARQAEHEARIAYGLAIGGYPGSALPHATRAHLIESRYHRHLIWRPFLQAIEAMIDEAGFVCETCGGDANPQGSKESVVFAWSMPKQVESASNHH